MANHNGLPTFQPGASTTIAQARIDQGESVTRESPALSVMTDLTKVRAVVTAPSTSLFEAEQIMIHQGVRLLFVVSAASTLEGLITSTDIHGERQMRLVAERASHFDELTVAEVMTGLSNLDAIDFQSMERATVGDLISTLERLGRNHLLVVKRSGDDGASSVCGIVSRAQIERQSGLVLAASHMASTFAEVERALS